MGDDVELAIVSPLQEPRRAALGASEGVVALEGKEVARADAAHTGEKAVGNSRGQRETTHVQAVSFQMTRERDP